MPFSLVAEGHSVFFITSVQRFFQLYIVDYHVAERALKKRYPKGHSALTVLFSSNKR
jgi:hypothetical protein